MRVLIVHNRYNVQGGEDVAFEREVRLLRSFGHDVFAFSMSNANLRQGASAALTALQLSYNVKSASKIRSIIADFSPDVVHAHNLFPQLSPSVLRVSKQLGLPTVMTVHNYRMICAGAQLLRDGRVCELCISKPSLVAIRDRCYRGSFVGSASLVTSIYLNRRFALWEKWVDNFIALTKFAKAKLVEAGFNTNKISVKPNFVEPSENSRPQLKRNFLFVGRLSREKGVRILLQAFAGIPELSLNIIGHGEDERLIREFSLPNVYFLGQLSQSEVQRHMSEAVALIVPSTWYEGFPLVVIEAYACSLPVIAADIGSLTEVVEHGVTGLHFKVGDAGELERAVKYLESSHVLRAKLQAGAKARYLRDYTPEKNIRTLETIYTEVMQGPKFSTTWQSSG